MWLRYLILVNLVCFSVASDYSSEEEKFDTTSCELTSYPPDPDTQCCGVDSTLSDKIVGGNETQLRQYPWLALIEYKNKNTGSIKSLCGGFLISGRYVVTAAHCVEGLKVSVPVRVRLGAHNKYSKGPECVTLPGGGKDCTKGPVIVPIEKVTVHASYDDDSSNKLNDIALIRLKNVVTYTDHVRPICLPKIDISRKSNQNLRLYAAGYGTMAQTYVGDDEYEDISSDVKRHVDLPYQNIKKCAKPWRTLDEKKQMCAGGEKGKDVCMGDSGGPLMMDSDGIFEALGIVSFGASSPCGAENYPGVYTKVFAYKKWIKKQIQIDEKQGKCKYNLRSCFKGKNRRNWNSIQSVTEIPYYRYGLKY